MKWEVIEKGKVNKVNSVIEKLLKNRGLKSKSEINDFINPIDPLKIKIQDLGIKKTQLEKIINRLKKAKEKNEKIVIFGDYDADGVCATAILWEAMYKMGYDVMPFIPDRFEDGYGFRVSSFQNQKLQIEKYKVVICVDNGIVAHDAIKKAKKQGIDVVVVDHHQKGKAKIDTNFVFHSTEVCGSALAWFLSKEMGVNNGLDLVALGTIADQMPLLKINRSLVKYGLPELTKTKRVGLLKMFKDSKIEKVGVYEVGYIIAPRINAMGRLASATDSLRFLCTRDPKKGNDLNSILNETNLERQKIVDEVLNQVLEKVKSDEKIIVVSGKYHEGVIGLASGKVTEKFYKPSIVLSTGEKVSKASARSISGFNIIEAIKETELILEGGGHPMAAGFSIETEKIKEFKTKINSLNINKLSDEILERKLKIDIEINFDLINKELIEELKSFEPTGQGNYSPVFMSTKVLIKEVKPVGQEGKHLKLKLEQNGNVFDAIAFGFTNSQQLKANDIVNVAYSIEENVWNNKTSIQLKIRDIKNDKDIK